MLSGESVLAVELDANLTVWDLKLRVLEAAAIEPSRQELFIDGEWNPLLDSTICSQLRGLRVNVIILVQFLLISFHKNHTQSLNNHYFPYFSLEGNFDIDAGDGRGWWWWWWWGAFRTPQIPKDQNESSNISKTLKNKNTIPKRLC